MNAAKEQPSVSEPGASRPKVAVVCVTYNRLEPLLVLMTQLRSLDYPAANFDIFLVDNASTDGTAERIRTTHPEINLIVSDENLGTSAGFNLGIEAALADQRNFRYIWLLDSDAEIESGTLAPIVTTLERESNIGIIGSTVFDPEQNDLTVASGLHINWRNGMVSLNKATGSEAGELVDADLIPACSLIIRAELCRSLGLWDERFWVYWGDTDWCQRVLHAGYRVCSHSRSRVWHRDWANTQRNFNAPTVIYDDLRGGLLFNIRHNPDQSLSGAKALLLKSYIKGAMEHLTLRPDFNDACEAAARDFLNVEFRRSNAYRGREGIEPVATDQLCEILAKTLPARPHVLIDQLPESITDRIREQLADYFPNARLTEKAPEQTGPKDDFTTNYGDYLRSELGELTRRLFMPRYDLVITDISKPHLYTLVIARHTLIINAAGVGVIRRNARLRGFAGMIFLLLKGLKVTYIDLPRGLKRNTKLQQAVADYS